MYLAKNSYLILYIPALRMWYCNINNFCDYVKKLSKLAWVVCIKCLIREQIFLYFQRLLCHETIINFNAKKLANYAWMSEAYGAYMVSNGEILAGPIIITSIKNNCLKIEK